MPEFLVFTLAAPMASFGGVAGNYRRSSMDRPGHSLVVGLLGAALGLVRDDERLPALAATLRVAVAMDTPGRALLDFHTVQTAKERKGFRPATRRQALADGDLNTIITEREYRTDVLATVAVTTEGGSFALGEMAAALETPRFTLYLGRKSCPLALPVTPRRLERADAAEAMRDYREGVASHMAALFGLKPEKARVAVDARLHPGQRGRRETRRTMPDDRRTWQYGLLDELVLSGDAP